MVQNRISDTPGEAFAGLVQQVDRGGTQQQEMTGWLTSADTLVDQSPQDLEQPWGTLDLVDHGQAASQVAKVTTGIGQLFQIGRVLQVQIDPGLGGRTGACQCGLAHLSGTEQGDGGELPQALFQA
jgi:hypothetical protein